MRKISSKIPIKSIAYSAVIAAMYFALTMLLQPISFGPIQFRLSEALVMLPYIMPESVVGITLGCLLANCFSTFPLYDAIFGTLATLLAGIATRYIKNRWLAGLPPIFTNALILPLMWYILGVETAYWISLLSIIASETAVVYAVGVPLIALLQKKAPQLVTRKDFSLPRPTEKPAENDVSKGDDNDVS